MNMVIVPPVLPHVSDSRALLAVGTALVLCTALHSLFLWLGNRGEAGLGHLLAATALQGLGLLGLLRAGGAWAPAAVFLVLASAYGLWGLRAYAGLPARPRPWHGVALGAWAVLALAFSGTGLAAPLLLALLAVGFSLKLRGVALREGQLPALACEGLALALALAALVSAVPAAFFAALPGAAAARLWFCFGILGAHQLLAVLLGQVQGQRLRRRLDGLRGVDTLTGLASAAGFGDRLGRAVGRSLRTGRVTSLLVLELDGHGARVDAHGRAALDFTLVAFARTLEATLREADLTGRLEGSRFAALLHQTHPAEAMLAAERLRSVWGNVPLTLGAGVFRPTFSAGVAGTSESVEDAAALLELALGRLGQVRAAGGDDISA